MSRFQPFWLVLLAFPSQAEDVSAFRSLKYKGAGGATLRYRLFVPAASPGAGKYPLVIWLHDIVGIGWDNHRQLTGANKAGAQLWIKPEIQARFPSFVLAPKCPPGALWVNFFTKHPSKKLRMAVDLVDQLLREYPIDPDRLYVVGQSMGAHGVWAMLEMRPGLFAAGVPVAGGGDPSKAATIATIPIWAFHGRKDLLVRVGASRRMIKALRAAGGSPRYTEYPNLGHSNKFFKTVFAEPDLPVWLFSQRK